jgi:hypothetical protein
MVRTLKATGVVSVKTMGVLAGMLLLAVAIGMRGGTQVFPGFRQLSPDGKYVASFYGLGGGGAAGWLFEYVSISPADGPSGSEVTVLEMNRGYEACLYWRDARHLVVTFPSSAEVLQAKTTISLDEKIYVSYESEPDSDGEFGTETCRGQIGRLRAVNKPQGE